MVKTLSVERAGLGDAARFRLLVLESELVESVLARARVMVDKGTFLAFTFVLLMGT